MGQVLTDLLDLVRIPHRTLSADRCKEDLNWAAQVFIQQRIPVALLVVKGVVRGLNRGCSPAEAGPLAPCWSCSATSLWSFATDLLPVRRMPSEIDRRIFI